MKPDNIQFLCTRFTVFDDDSSAFTVHKFSIRSIIAGCYIVNCSWVEVLSVNNFVTMLE